MSFIVKSETKIQESVALQPKVSIRPSSSQTSHSKIIPKQIDDIECSIVPKKHIEVGSYNYTLSECHSDIVFLAERLYSLDKAETEGRHSYTSLFIITVLLLALAVFVLVTKYV